MGEEGGVGSSVRGWLHMRKVSVNMLRVTNRVVIFEKSTSCGVSVLYALAYPLLSCRSESTGPNIVASDCVCEPFSLLDSS